jgi:hypothetical protein
MPSRRRSPTTWRVTNLPDPSSATVTCEGHDHAGIPIIDDTTIEITSDVDDHFFDIHVLPITATSRTGANATITQASGLTAVEPFASPAPDVGKLYVPTSAPSCPCCSA